MFERSFRVLLLLVRASRFLYIPARTVALIGFSLALLLESCGLSRSFSFLLFRVKNQETYITMDTIKKKLSQLKADKEKALDEKDVAEASMKEAMERVEQVKKTQQKNLMKISLHL